MFSVPAVAGPDRRQRDFSPTAAARHVSTDFEPHMAVHTSALTISARLSLYALCQTDMIPRSSRPSKLDGTQTSCFTFCYYASEERSSRRPLVCSTMKPRLEMHMVAIVPRHDGWCTQEQIIADHLPRELIEQK